MNYVNDTQAPVVILEPNVVRHRGSSLSSNPTDHHRSGRPWLSWIFGVLLIGVVIILLMASFSYWSLIASLDGSSTPTTFKVESGQHAADIAKNLEQAGFVRSALATRGYLRITHQSFKAGIYSLVQDGSSIQNIEPILQGGVAERQITIPEGLRLSEVAQLLEAKGIVNATDLLAAARYNPGLVHLPESYNLKSDTFLEGFLFPDTYRFAADATANDVIKRMMTNFLTRTQSLTMNYDTLILASIVEREAKFDVDRPLIASVFSNRLAAGMALQSDVTVEYAVANLAHGCLADPAGCATSKLDPGSSEGWWLPVTSTALDSPYNTYQQTGLPPRPISNPGLKSIEAATNPANTNYLYFVADKEGHAHYGKTLVEHNANVAKYVSQ